MVTPATDDHIEALLPHLTEGLRALITLMTFTGLRTGEALRVTSRDIRDGYIHVAKTKNDEPRMVPVPHGWKWPPNGWGVSTTQGVGKALRRAHHAAGLPYRDGHELGRHAFAARWLKAGKGMKGLQIAGGWKKFSIPADIYGHLEITDIHQQMRELSQIRAKSVQSTGVETPKANPRRKKGPMHQGDRPKSREETPKKGMRGISASQGAYGSATWFSQEGPRPNFAQMVKLCAMRSGGSCINN